MLFSDEGGMIPGRRHQPLSTRAGAFNRYGRGGETGRCREDDARPSAGYRTQAGWFVLHPGRPGFGAGLWGLSVGLRASVSSMLSCKCPCLHYLPSPI